MILLLLAVLAAAPASGPAASREIASPDGHVVVQVSVESGRPRYSVRLRGTEVLKPSPLGLRLAATDFTSGVKLGPAAPVETVKQTYALAHGKRRSVSYEARRGTVSLADKSGTLLEVLFHVANDGVAFRYRIPRLGGRATVSAEDTGFAFPEGTRVWMHPMHDAKTGWMRTFPSYEAHYVADAPAGTPSPEKAGWCLPALFKAGDKAWALVTETDADGQYVAARLRRESPGGLYSIGFPDPQEQRGEIDPVSPTIEAPFASPWRVIIVGETLRPIVESTLVTDLARPPAVEAPPFVKPGRSAWSWLQLDDKSCVLPVQLEFVDFAAKMGWEYLLVDALWDQQIGWEGIEQILARGKEKGVGIWLWYNSNGPWNDAPQTPKDRMYEPGVRKAEMARLQKAGVKGIKVDFLGGDKQSSMQYYLDVIKDAGDHGLMINFHGATLPRGWERTYPHLMTMEAVKGMEFAGFEQVNADEQPKHCAILPFTRNVVGPMDFTPTVFNPRMRANTRRTSDAFELALSVLFESGVQHLGLTPPEVEKAPAFVVEALKALPATWDDVRFLDGYPGRYAVVARRAGSDWWIAGINGAATAQDVSLDLSFAGAEVEGAVIADGDGGRGFALRKFAAPSSSPFGTSLPGLGGFLIRVSGKP